MVVGLPFTPAHIDAVAVRAAELEQMGEDLQDPGTMVRAARLYTLAVRIADDIDQRGTKPFSRADLARVRDELRVLATDAAASGILGDHGIVALHRTDPSGRVTSAFREIAVRIEQRLTMTEVYPTRAVAAEPRL